MKTKDKPQVKHIGRNIGRMREMLRIKQETLAEELGISQQAVSKIEQSEEVEDGMVEKIAKALGIKSDSIKEFNEEMVVYNIQNNYDSSSNNSGPHYYCTFNPIDKWMDAMGENKKLYEALLKSEREKVEMLERMLSERKKG